MRDRPFNIMNRITRLKRFGSQNYIDCNDSKAMVCIHMHSLYGLTGTGAAFHISFLTCTAAKVTWTLMMTIRMYNSGRH